MSNRILVFRTSVSSRKHIKQLQPLFEKIFDNGEQWNFDLEDWEKILRVEGRNTSSRKVINTLQSAGFFCEELED